MDFKIFLEEHWDVFLKHVCQFYPLDHELTEKFKYELDWTAISKNKALDWTLEFLVKNESLFAWHELAWNSRIKWTSEWINHFNQRLDWYYLGRNTNLPISEAFIKEFQKKMFIIETNVFLNEDLKKMYGKGLLPAVPPTPDYIKEEDLKDIEKVLSGKHEKFSTNSTVFYENYIAKYLKDKNLKEIFEARFPYGQRFFYLEPIHNDEYGLTPEFEVEGKNPFFDTFNRSEKDEYITELEDQLSLVNGSLQEGKARLLEMPRFNTYTAHPVLLVSENVKTILQHFNLPRHRFDLVKMNPKKITTRTRFYLFQLDRDTLSKDLNFKEVQFFYKIESSFSKASSEEWKKMESPISDYKDLMKSLEILRQPLEIPNYINYVPDKFILKSNYDIYSYSVYNKVIVSDFLKKELERLLPGQIHFRSAESLSIRFYPEVYSEMASRKFNLPAVLNPVKYISATDDQFFYEKKKRLEHTEVLLPESPHKADEFTETEKTLHVIFPEKFKKYYKKSTAAGEYTLLPLSSFYIQNEYSDRYPETYNAVIFAENGCGDSLGLLLDKKSDFKLDTKIYEFLHETGELNEAEIY